MSENTDFQNAMVLLQSGRRKEATKEFLNLYTKVTSIGFRLQVIDALLSSLDPIRQTNKLIEVADDGINIAQQLNRPEMKAHFMAAKATHIMKEIYSLKYRQYNLKLLPQRWINFSTERDQAEYAHVTKAIDDKEDEVDNLISEATKLADLTNNKVVQAYVAMSVGDVHHSRYMNLKMDAIPGRSMRAKWWRRLKPLRQRGLENYLFFNLHEIRALRNHLSRVERSFLRAAELFRAINDPSEAHAFYNLANHLRISFKFRQAINYLKKARVVAQKHNQELLVKQIDELARIVKTRNKDVPNYLEGETRKEVTLD